MDWTTLKGSGVARVWAVLSLIVALLVGFGGIAIAEPETSDSRPRARALEGTWLVQVTLRDCVTNAPLGPSFRSLVTFHRGGTLSESAGSLAFAVGQRSTRHGTWTRLNGHTFRQRMVALILFDNAPNLPGSPGFNPSLPVSPGFFAGWQTITHTGEVSNADHVTSAGTNRFYKSNGELYRTGCSTATSQRFE